MFKALDESRGGTPIVSLDDEWEAPSALEALRERCRENQVHCPWCHAPVLIRAGQILVRHFAHKHLKDCPYAHESAEKLAGRQLIYEWLIAKFGRENVEIEVMPDGLELPMPLDAFVRTGGKRIGYWFFNRNIRLLDTRDMLMDAIREAVQADACLHVVFSSKLLNLIDEYPDLARLSPTHRDFMASTPYDAPVGGKLTLHFLDTSERMMTTLRGLRLFEWPQTFKFGALRRSTLDQLQVRPSTGEVVHPGEHESLRESEKIPNDPPDQKNIQLSGKAHPALSRPMTGRQEPHPPATTGFNASRGKEIEAEKVDIWNRNRAAICELCGTLTHEDDWIVHNGSTQTCKCRRCIGSPRR